MGKMPHIIDLHQAIVANDTGRVANLAACSTLDLSLPVRGTTALSLAVYKGHVHLVLELVKAGADLDRRSKDHLDRIETPLITAIRLGHEDIFRELVHRGARLDLRDFYNQTPLWFAVKEQRHSFVRVLLQAGAPIKYTWAAENPLNLAMQFLGYKGRREMALELLAAGLPLGLEDYKGRSPLFWAMKHLDKPFFRLLVEAGAPLSPREWLSVSRLSHEWAQDEDFTSWFQQELTHPPPLLRCCRTSIRDLLRASRGTDIRPLVEDLPLPPPLRRVLLLQDLLAETAQEPPRHREAGSTMEVVPTPPQLAMV
ncbi:uncharacterized protein LOC143037897 [Oratosquilla oratoria]|uniref:uncharacterized protein LOC143037897 n=1 Tax=Oratosquilla oratoria TaxID=337810 RepID=UPI003F76D756